MFSYLINVARGQSHKLFGHPKDAVQIVDDSHQPGLHLVEFRCRECGRGFKKQICGTCERTL